MVIACTVCLFVLNTLLGPGSSVVVVEKPMKMSLVVSGVECFFYPVRNPVNPKCLKIEAVRQNVKKMGADRRSNFVFRKPFYQKRQRLSRLDI
jgi:hypothetical protein